MSNQERYQTALTRIKAGETIEGIIKALYKNWRHYKKQASEDQRAEIRAARWEYMASRGNKTPKGQKRIIFVVTEDWGKEIIEHCKQKKIPVSRFINSATRLGLAISKSHKEKEVKKLIGL